MLLVKRKQRRILPSHEELHELLSFDPSTGGLEWRARGNPQFDGQFAGKPAFTFRGPRYFEGRINGVGFLAHRVIWKLVYGDEPFEIDHINGNGFDNRIANLRAVSHQENARNQRLNVRSSSGSNGVAFVQRVNRWRAHITVDGVQTHLGYFESFDDAVEARSKADREHGFHQHHGRPHSMFNPHLLPKIRSEKLTKSAKGQPCSLRLPMICNRDDETTVLAHLPVIGKGMGTKVSDLFGAFACSSCHDAIDRHTYEKAGLTRAQVYQAMLWGLCETQSRWVGMGLIEVKGMELL